MKMLKYTLETETKLKLNLKVNIMRVLSIRGPSESGEETSANIWFLFLALGIDKQQ